MSSDCRIVFIYFSIEPFFVISAFILLYFVFMKETLILGSTIVVSVAIGIVLADQLKKAFKLG